MNYFTIPTNPSINELINWFQIEFTPLANAMKASNHNTVPDEPNPYHLEDQVWAHTCMVALRAEILDVPKINKICAILHDIGKPIAREVIDFEAKKPVHSDSNQIRNDGKNDGKPSGLQRVMPKSGKKCHFRGHEGLSFYLAIEPLLNLKSLGVLDDKEVQTCLQVISMHGSLFDNIDADGNMKKESKVFDKFLAKDVDVFNHFILQVKCDSLGRFFMSKDGRKNNAERLCTEIFTAEQFLSYHREKAVRTALTASHQPWIEVLIGVPGSGKSTYLKDKVYTPESAPIIISRDDTLMEFAKANNVPGNYSEVWNKLTPEDQKIVDQVLENKFKKAFNDRENIIVDMTNMSNKAQRKWTNKVNAPKIYRAKATVFVTSYDEVYRRLKKREQETGKAIPDFVVKNMMKGFMVPNYSVFEDIKYIF